MPPEFGTHHLPKTLAKLGRGGEQTLDLKSNDTFEQAPNIEQLRDLCQKKSKEIAALTNNSHHQIERAIEDTIKNNQDSTVKVNLDSLIQQEIATRPESNEKLLALQKESSELSKQEIALLDTLDVNAKELLDSGTLIVPEIIQNRTKFLNYNQPETPNSLISTVQASKDVVFKMAGDNGLAVSKKLGKITPPTGVILPIHKTIKDSLPISKEIDNSSTIDFYEQTDELIKNEIFETPEEKENIAQLTPVAEMYANQIRNGKIGAFSKAIFEIEKPNQYELRKILASVPEKDRHVLLNDLEVKIVEKGDELKEQEKIENRKTIRLDAAYGAQLDAIRAIYSKKEIKAIIQKSFSPKTVIRIFEKDVVSHFEKLQEYGIPEKLAKKLSKKLKIENDILIKNIFGENPTEFVSPDFENRDGFQGIENSFTEFKKNIGILLEKANVKPSSGSSISSKDADEWLKNKNNEIHPDYTKIKKLMKQYRLLQNGSQLESRAYLDAEYVDNNREYFVDNKKEIEKRVEKFNETCLDVLISITKELSAEIEFATRKNDQVRAEDFKSWKLDILKEIEIMKQMIDAPVIGYTNLGGGFSTTRAANLEGVSLTTVAKPAITEQNIGRGFQGQGHINEVIAPVISKCFGFKGSAPAVMKNGPEGQTAFLIWRPSIQINKLQQEKDPQEIRNSFDQNNLLSAGAEDYILNETDGHNLNRAIGPDGGIVKFDRAFIAPDSKIWANQLRSSILEMTKGEKIPKNTQHRIRYSLDNQIITNALGRLLHLSKGKNGLKHFNEIRGRAENLIGPRKNVLPASKLIFG